MELAHRGLKRLVPPADAKRLRSERGAIAYWEVAPRIYVTHVQGYMSRDMSQLIISQAEGLYAGGAFVAGFHNWIEMSNYDSQCRVELTSWVLGHRKQTALHIAVASRIVSMGVSVANLTLGSLIRMYTTEIALEHALGSMLAAKGLK